MSMEEIVRTNNIVVLSLIESILQAAEIPVFIADQHVSAMEGSIGAFPRRVLVPKEAVDDARDILIEHGLEAELLVK